MLVSFFFFLLFLFFFPLLPLPTDSISRRRSCRRLIRQTLPYLIFFNYLLIYLFTYLFTHLPTFVLSYPCRPNFIRRETTIGEILGGGEQHASAMQVPRYVGFLRAQDLLESGAGFPNSREDAQGPISKRCAGGAKQPGQRDPVDQSERIAEEEAGSAEAEETSRWVGRERA